MKSYMLLPSFFYKCYFQLDIFSLFKSSNNEMSFYKGFNIMGQVFLLQFQYLYKISSQEISKYLYTHKIQEGSSYILLGGVWDSASRAWRGGRKKWVAI